MIIILSGPLELAASIGGDPLDPLRHASTSQR